MIRQDREDVFVDIATCEAKAKTRNLFIRPCKVPSLPFCDPDGCTQCKESVRKHKVESIFKSLGE